MSRTEYTATGQLQTGEQDLHGWSVPHPCMPQPETCVSWCGQGLGSGTWGLESRPREGTAIGLEETA